MKIHLFTYRYQGAEWNLEVQGDTPADAKARLAAMALARYDGELIAKVPAGVGFLARAIVWLRNFWG